MHIVYIFRKSSPSFHSVEALFQNIQECLPNSVTVTNYYVPFHSKGLFRRIWNAVNVSFNQNEVNHITGDIHYVAVFLSKRKTVLTIHDLGSILRGNALKRAALKFFWFTMPLARVQYVTVISEFTKSELLKEFKINPDKVKVIHDCVSPKLKPADLIKNDQFTILQIGTKQNKNLENLALALDGIDCKLLIVGKLSNSQIHILKQSNVEYEEHVDIPFADLVKLYERTDILAFVSKYEGFGMPIIEANTVGRAVIASNQAAIPEIAGDAALLVDSENVQEIREGIKKLMHSEDLRSDLVEKGYINAKRFRGERIAEEYVKLYQEMIT